tara:strand:- start:1640 stop:3967 length:2328 start_codon:yes stop_codon:yes gene_type:complete
MELINFLVGDRELYIRCNVYLGKDGKKKVEGVPKDWTEWNADKCRAWNKKAPKHYKIANVNLSKLGIVVADDDSLTEEGTEIFWNRFNKKWVTKSIRRKQAHVWMIRHPDDCNTTTTNYITGVDLLYQNVFEHIDSKIKYCEGDMPTFDTYPQLKNTPEPVEKKKENTYQENMIKSMEKKENFEIKVVEQISEEDKQILDNIKTEYWDNYEIWLDLIWGIYNKYGDINLCDHHSKKSSKYDGIATVKKKIESDTKRAITWGSVCRYSKLSNEERFYEIKRQYLTTYTEDDYSIANLFINLSNGELVKQDDCLYAFVDPYWVKDNKENVASKRMLRKVINDFYRNESKRLNKEAEESNDQIKRETLLKRALLASKLMLKINSSSKQKSVLEQVIIHLDNNDYKFDSIRPNLFCFKNTAFDLLLRKQVKVQKTDYITKHTGYDWQEPKQTELDKIQQIMGDIMPNAEVLETLYSVLRECLVGKQTEKFVMLNGVGCNGKGWLLELLRVMLTVQYADTGHNSLLVQQAKTGSNPELANLDKKRCVIFSEINETDRMSGANIKQLTGNPYVNARANYSNQTQCHIQALFLVECNQRPSISGRCDNALLRRIIDICFPTTFTNDPQLLELPNHLPKDPALKSEAFQDTHKFAFFQHILLSKHDEVYMCPEVQQRSAQYLSNNDELLTFINENYKFTKDNKDIERCKDIYENFQKSDTYHNFTKEQKRNEWSRSKFIEKISNNVVLGRHYVERNMNQRNFLQGIILDNENQDDNDKEEEDN